jgi:hypothetical protein
MVKKGFGPISTNIVSFWTASRGAARKAKPSAAIAVREYYNRAGASSDQYS